MSRKMKQVYTNINPTSVILDEDELKFLDNAAANCGQTRSQMLSSIMLLSLNRLMCQDDNTDLTENAKLVPSATVDDHIVQSTKP